MKKLIYLIAFALILPLGNAFSQSAIAKGQTQLNFGVGFSNWGIPLYIGLDFGVHPDISLGAEFSFRSYHENWKNNYYSHNVLGISGNANYHFNRILKIAKPWDFYAGLNLGFYFWSSPNEYYGDHNSGAGLGAQIGGRYYFNEKLGINLEFGGGNAFSGGKLGLTLKL